MLLRISANHAAISDSGVFEKGRRLLCYILATELIEVLRVMPLQATNHICIKVLHELPVRYVAFARVSK
jgi:hypothetical protein